MAGKAIGIAGLGTMGAALALNIADKGFAVAGWNRSADALGSTAAQASGLAGDFTGFGTLEDFVAALTPPRAVILMVPAGDPVDQMIAALRPLMDEGDLIVDGGNANFHDTERRAGPGFIGLGVSGGEEGARHGPSIMAGGDPQDWQRVAPILRAIAARHGDEPCAAWLGPGGAGHFVKTVHNGIEYALMQAIAEVYGLMRDGLSLEAGAIGDMFAQWNAGPLRSYLVEITAEVARAVDPHTGNAMLDVIADRAGQKGTGRWSAIEAHHLGVPVPMIEAAVTARNVSARAAQRNAGATVHSGGAEPVALTRDDLRDALIAANALAYAQGFSMLRAGSDRQDWAMPLAEVARVWRAGCIIRSDLLDPMAEALGEDPARDLTHAPVFADLLRAHIGGLRRCVAAAAVGGHAVPVLAAGLAGFDGLRQARGTANMLQAQRDYFGAHGFDRVDGFDARHGPWGR